MLTRSEYVYIYMHAYVLCTYTCIDKCTHTYAHIHAYMLQLNTIYTSGHSTHTHSLSLSLSLSLAHTHTSHATSCNLMMSCFFSVQTHSILFYLARRPPCTHVDTHIHTHSHIHIHTLSFSHTYAHSLSIFLSHTRTHTYPMHRKGPLFFAQHYTHTAAINMFFTHSLSYTNTHTNVTQRTHVVFVVLQHRTQGTAVSSQRQTKCRRQSCGYGRNPTAVKPQGALDPTCG
jgi:hypothetical protein